MFVAAGVLGVLLGMLVYVLLVTGRVTACGPAYLTINITASLLVLLSLTQQFNLPALIINVFYLGVSIWGLCKCLRKNNTSSSV